MIRGDTDNDDSRIGARIAFPDPAAAALWGPWAAFVPAVELAARMTAAMTAVGWSVALGPWTARTVIERRDGGGS